MLLPDCLGYSSFLELDLYELELFRGHGYGRPGHGQQVLLLQEVVVCLECLEAHCLPRVLQAEICSVQGIFPSGDVVFRLSAGIEGELQGEVIRESSGIGICLGGGIERVDWVFAGIVLPAVVIIGSAADVVCL